MSEGQHVEEAEFEPLQVALRGPSPSLVADLGSIEADLVFAAQCSAAFAELSESGDVEDYALVMRALWNAGVIAYRRAFGSGKAHLVEKTGRPRLDRYLLANADQDQKLVHDRVLELANQHVAHQVGQQQQVLAVAVLAPPPLEPDVLGVGTLFVDMVGPEAELASKLSSLCDFFSSVVRQEKERRSDDLHANLRTPDGIARLYENAGAQEPPDS